MSQAVNYLGQTYNDVPVYLIGDFRYFCIPGVGMIPASSLGIESGDSVSNPPSNPPSNPANAKSQAKKKDDD